MTVSAADYAWFEDRLPELAEAYCVTLVRGLPPAEVLRRLDGREESALTGVDAAVEAAFALLDRPDGARQFVAMTTVGDWTLLIEPNGYVGVTEDVARPASAGTAWVSHFVNINGLDYFLWAEDGVVRVGFEPMFPEERVGSTPDELLPAMGPMGFHFGDDSPDPDVSSAAAFALAQHLTGVAVTPELLTETVFWCGSVPVPR
ncbi:hypothetical protein GTW40_08140 [Streptomyces sp. SID4985]|uniref:DUF6461 domain-containing protein n=1 Tax=Streptomyces sp. SID4985 TaxID=2690292 RepID=UPI001369F125|nr:DUF6461 domain-containing protein [Streptomyces sp. SID4985]MYQ45028.1 hypothetical protein [Streptomyces sp. SID4985]